MLLFVLIFLVNAHEHGSRDHNTRPVPEEVCYSDVSIKRCWPLRLCGLQKPSCSNSTKCPTCLPNSFLNDMCKKRVENLCNGTTEPTAVRGADQGLCPSCRKVWARQCDEPSRRKCQKYIHHTNSSRVRLCARGERPHNIGCCFSCIPPPLTQNCSKEAVDKCKRAFKDKPDCIDGESPAISDCCRTCQIKDANNTRPNGGTGKCEYKKFRKALQKVPECDVNEIGVTDVNSTRCAPSCRRVESHYALEDIVDCLKSRTACTAEGDIVRILPGDMCHRCFKPRPTCRQSCRSNQTCINEDLNVTRCERKKLFRLIVKIKRTVLFERMKGLTRTEIVQVLLEFAERFCERNDQATRCENSLGPLRESLSCKRLRQNGTDVIELDLEASERGRSRQKNARRLLEEEGPAELMKNALEDSEDDVGSAVLTDPTNPVDPTNPPTSPPTNPVDPDRSASFTTSVSALLMLVSMMIYQ